MQLFHISNCGDIEDPDTFREYWYVTNRIGESGIMERVKVDRGPIFDRHGKISLDYDPLFRIPIYVMSLNESFGFPWVDEAGNSIRIKNIEDTMSGTFLLALNYWLTPAKTRIKKNRAELCDDLRSRGEEIGGTISDHLWFEANKTGETHNHGLAYKHYKDEIARYDGWINDDRLDELYKVPA